MGDQLGDKDSSVFASEMAKKLLRTVWTGSQLNDDLKDAFLELNLNLKGLVIQKMGVTTNIMTGVVKKWPHAMQQVSS